MPSSGNFELQEQIGGVTFARVTTGNILSNGDRCKIVCDGTKISGYINDVLKWNYTSGRNFWTATDGKLQSLGTEGAVSDIAVYNHSPSALSATGRRAGAWSFFGVPHGVRYAGTSDRTYATYTDDRGNAWILAYDHDTNAMIQPFLLHTLAADDHAHPNLLVRNDGKIMVWEIGHNGPTIWQRTSTNAEDISAWGTDTSLDAQLGGGQYGYPTPVQLTGEVNNPIYLIYRDEAGPEGLGIYYSKSTDGGVTWATGKMIFGGGTYIPYMQVAQNGTSRIDFIMTDGHPDLTEHVSIYHFYYSAGHWYKSDGTDLGDDAAALPLAPADVTKAYDGATTSAWDWDLAIDGSGNPVFVFATFPGATWSAGDTPPDTVPDHRYRYAIWNGSAWNDYEICVAGTSGLYAAQPYYSGGVALDHDDVNTIYASRQVSGQWEMFRYTTADGGQNWTLAETITSGSSYPNIRPVVPRNSSNELKVIWLYGRYTTFSDFELYLRSSPQY